MWLCCECLQRTCCQIDDVFSTSCFLTRIRRGELTGSPLDPAGIPVTLSKYYSAKIWLYIIYGQIDQFHMKNRHILMVRAHI